MTIYTLTTLAGHAFFKFFSTRNFEERFHILQDLEDERAGLPDMTQDTPHTRLLEGQEAAVENNHRNFDRLLARYMMEHDFLDRANRHMAPQDEVEDLTQRGLYDEDGNIPKSVMGL